VSQLYEQEQIEIKEQTVALQAELGAYNFDSVRADKFVELVQRYTRFEELTTPMINEFIDKIIVYEAEWSEGFNAENNRQIGRASCRERVFQPV
jgi:hypothetical protein